MTPNLPSRTVSCVMGETVSSPVGPRNRAGPTVEDGTEYMRLRQQADPLVTVQDLTRRTAARRGRRPFFR